MLNWIRQIVRRKEFTGDDSPDDFLDTVELLHFAKEAEGYTTVQRQERLSHLSGRQFTITGVVEDVYPICSGVSATMKLKAFPKLDLIISANFQKDSSDVSYVRSWMVGDVHRIHGTIEKLYHDQVILGDCSIGGVAQDSNAKS